MSFPQYRHVPIGERSPEAVTVSIKATTENRLKAAVWWEGAVDADQGQYDTISSALAAAEAAKASHGLKEVVVALSQPDLWDRAWGELTPSPIAREPLGDLRATDLSSDEAFDLASGIEAQRDA